MKTKKQFTNRILSLVLTLVMVLCMMPLSAFAASGYSYIDADGSKKNVVSATEITSSTTTWNSGWYYVGANVTISSRITVSGDVKLILGAGYTLTASEGIWVSGGNTLTVYSQQTVGSLVATGVEWSAAIGGNGKAGSSGANVNTSVGTIIINGGNVTATGGDFGAGIGSGWGGTGGSVTVNGGNVTATGGDSGAGIGSSQMATNNINITITGGNVNATGGMGAASIGTGYAANHVAIIHISGGNITAERNWAAASIGNGVSVNSATTVSITGGVIDAELIGNYNGGWTAEITEISGTTFLKDPSAYIIKGQYVEKDTDGKYHVHWGGAYISGISQVNSITVMLNGNVYAISTEEYRIIDGTLHLFVSQGDLFVTVNNTDYYGIYSGNSSELQKYYKVTNLNTIPTAINANAAYELATTVTPENALNQTFSYEVTDAGTTGAFLNGNILTAPYSGELTLKVTARDPYKTYSKTFTIKVTQTAVTGISGDDVIPTTAESVPITLPTAVLPTNASYKTIVWSVIEGPAVISNGILKFISSGECVVRATVKNGIANGEDYTKDYKIKITSPSAIDVSQGNIVFSKQDENTMEVTYENGQQMTFSANQMIAVTGSTNRYHIIIESGSPNLILQDCNISVTDSAAMSIQSGASAELTLVGTNKLEGIGGIHVPSGASLSIDGTGTLTAISVTRFEAGIGGGDKDSGGTITINGGTVTATGGEYGAGIGGGNDGSGGTITINGGTVTATGEYGAGIGGGSDGSSGGTITITGGTVTATGNVYGAGIGGGWNGSGGTITLNGGTVTATGVKYGAGIGGGGGSAGNGGAITINGGTVKATGGEYGAGIGGGDRNSGGTITITGGTVTATGGVFGAGIGGGDAGNGGTITITGGTVTATGGQYGAGIGGGDSGNGGNVIITGGNVKTVPGTRKSEAIGKGDGGSDSGTLKDTTGNDLILNTIMLNGATADTTVTVTKGITYGLNDVKTLDTDKLYFYLPVDTAATAITAGGVEYICNRNNVYYTNHGNDGYNNITKNTHNVICSECEMVFSADVLHTYDENKKCVCGYINHTHEWSYSVSGTKISAICSNADGGCTNTNGGSVTLNVSDACFTGNTIGATTDGSFTNGATYKLTYNDSSETAPSSIGTHTATLTVNENGTEKQSITAEYKISYLPVPQNAYSISGHSYYDEVNDAYWFKSGDIVTVNAPREYTVSTLLNGTYGDSVEFFNGDDMVIYLKNDAGAMTGAINIEGVCFDENDPTGNITIENRGFWEKLISKITFGLFFKGDAVATVTSSDVDSGVKSVEYYVASEDLIGDATLDNAAAVSKLENAIGGNWKTYSNEIALSNNAKNVIYVKITDNVGNVTYISGEGIVLYSDAKAETESVTTTYKAGEDKDISVELNGNTVNAIKNGDDVLTTGTDYTVSNDGIITLKADYLDTLNAGTYTFTVSYNPLGETYVEAAVNEAPATTTFTLTVAQADITNADVTVNGSFTYNGKAQTPEPVVIWGGVTLVKDRDYSVAYSDNTNAGNATVTVSGKGNYSGTASEVFNIGKVAITVTADAKSKVYGEGDPALTWSITSGALVNGEQLMGITISRVSGENANAYAITVSQAEGVNKNYDITFVGGTFTINAKTVDATVTVNGAPFSYNGSEQKPEIVVKDGDTVIPANEYEVSYASNTNAGTATVTVTDKVGGNYVVNGSATFIINKADPLIGNVGVDGVVKDSTRPSEVVLTRTDTTVGGVLKLADGAMLANKSTYRWVFTPIDIDNYNVINGEVQIDVRDTVLPTAVIKVDTNEWKQFINNITFGLFFKDTQEVTITADDNENGSGIKDIVYFVSDREYEADELRHVEWKTYTEAFGIEPDGKFVIYAKVTDNDGNAVIINSGGVVVDETAAVVSGITDGETYYGQLVFTVADELAGVKSVIIDGNDETHFEGQYVINADNAEHTVTVTDNAGNVTEYKVTVYKNYTVTYTADGESVSTETVGHGKDATLPAVPHKDGYIGKWDSDGKNITEDTTISVIYTEIPVVKPDEVKLEDKTDLEDTKAKLEEELEDDSYTEDDKKAIQDAIDDIDDALRVIGNVEKVEELIDKLSDTIKKDDEAAIKAADDAYNALSDYEKSLVDEDAKKALEDAKAALAELKKSADHNSPATGDNSHMALWIALLFISGGALITLTVVDRKRRTAKR